MLADTVVELQVTHRNTGNIVRLAHNGLLFRSRLDGISDDKTTLQTELAPPIEASKGIKSGYYNGAVVTDETLKARYRVKSVVEGKLVLDRPVSASDFADSDKDGRRVVYIYDHAEGDEFKIPQSVFIKSGEKPDSAVTTRGL